MSDDELSKNKTALGYASLTAFAAWQAARIKGDASNPAMVAEIEAKIECGEATLAVFVQRCGANVRLTASVCPPGYQDPFNGALLDVSGPLVVTPEQLARLFAVQPKDLN